MGWVVGLLFVRTTAVGQWPFGLRDVGRPDEIVVSHHEIKMRFKDETPGVLSYRSNNNGRRNRAIVVCHLAFTSEAPLK